MPQPQKEANNMIYAILGAILIAQSVFALYERKGMLREIHRLTELVAAKDLSEFKANEAGRAKTEHIDLFSEREKKRRQMRTGSVKGV
jgi:hypothetical protein